MEDAARASMGLRAGRFSSPASWKPLQRSGACAFPVVPGSLARKASGLPGSVWSLRFPVVPGSLARKASGLPGVGLEPAWSMPGVVGASSYERSGCVAVFFGIGARGHRAPWSVDLPVCFEPGPRGGNGVASFWLSIDRDMKHQERAWTNLALHWPLYWQIRSPTEPAWTGPIRPVRRAGGCVMGNAFPGGAVPWACARSHAFLRSCIATRVDSGAAR